MTDERSSGASRRISDNNVGMILVLTSATLFGTTGTALAQVPGRVDPWSAGVLRLLIGGGALAVLARRDRARLASVRTEVGLGAMAVAVYQLGFFWSVTETGVATGTLVTIGISPIASRLLGSLLGRPSPPKSWYLAAVLLVGGLVVLVLGGYEDVEIRPVGIIAAVVAGAAFAAYTECGSRALARGASPDLTMAALFFGAGLLTSPLLLWRGVDILSTARGALVLAHLSLITLTVAYVAFGRGLRRLPPTIVTMLTIAEPVVATALSFLILHEEISPVGWLGASIVVLGLPVVGLASRDSNSGQPDG
ncbi:MAG: DMT family transporter [Ilumatobacteraceae bacterium]